MPQKQIRNKLTSRLTECCSTDQGTCKLNRSFSCSGQRDTHGVDLLNNGSVEGLYITRVPPIWTLQLRPPKGVLCYSFRKVNFIPSDNSSKLGKLTAVQLRVLCTSMAKVDVQRVQGCFLSSLRTLASYMMLTLTMPVIMCGILSPRYVQDCGAQFLMSFSKKGKKNYIVLFCVQYTVSVHMRNE